MKKILINGLLGLAFICSSSSLFAQGLDVTSCPTIDKRSNGNGQYALAAGTFPTFFSNPVAVNVVGTPHQTVSYLPNAKTGDVNFYWSSSITISRLPIITRVWLTAKGSTSAVLSSIKFGPPPPPVVVGQRYYVNYNFYNQNMPAAGKVTLEFADPVTNVPAFYCTFDLQQNTSATPPTLDCTPVITQQPSNINLNCNDVSATFNIVASGVGSYQWQASTNKGSTWSNVTNSGDYSGVSSSSLTVINPDNHDSTLYRVILSNTNCANTTSNTAMLVSKTLPTATFNGAANVCGLANQTLRINLVGSAPWTVIYSKTPVSGSPTNDTIKNIKTNPYYFAVNPTVKTTYQLLSVSDNYCTNNISSNSNTSVSLNAIPSLSVINDTVCLNSNNFLFRYTSTGGANQYSISKGLRNMPGFTNIVDANLSSSPINISIPNTGVQSGYYDFNVTVKNSTTGCVSEVRNLTVFVAPGISMSASANKNNFCAGASVVLTAAPAGLVSYTWTASDLSTVASVINPTVIVNSNTTYTVTGIDINGCTYSANITLNPTSNTSITLTPNAASICYGNSTVITASGGSTYTWSPSTGLSNTTGSSVIASPTRTTTYTVTSQNATGCNSISTVTVTVDSPAVSVTPSAILCLGSIKTLVASGASTYYWYPYTGLYADAAASIAYTGSSLSTVYAKPNNSITYYVNGTTVNNCSNTASSTITINQAPINLATSTGGQQTSNSYIFCSKDVATFDVQVNLTTAVTSATWAYSTDSINYTSFTTAVSPTGATLTPSSTGANNRTLTINGFSSGGYAGPRFLRLLISYQSCTYNYDIKLFDTKGSGTTPIPVPSKSLICPGDSASISLGAPNAIYTLQWQSATTINGTYTNISGATSSRLNTGPLSATKYFKAVFDATGNVCDYTTDPVTITIAASPAANTISANNTCTDGSTTIVLTGSTVSSANYQWESSTTGSTSGFSSILGAINKDYTLPVKVLNTTTWYRRKATVGLCSDVLSAATAIYAPITNNQISNSPTSFCGTATAVTINANTPSGGNGSYTYQWEISSTSATTGFTSISLATSANYTTTTASANSWYRRVVSSGTCSNTSPAFLISVNTKPTVTVPATQNICSGSAISLSATGGENYLWKPATGLNSNTGATVIASPTTTTTYTVIVSNSYGCTDSATVLVNVTTSPNAPVLSTNSKTICSSVGSFDISTLITSGSNVEWYSIPEVNASYKLASTVLNSNGTYYAFSKNGNCYSASYATLVFSINDASTPNVSATSISLCAPQTANLVSLQPASRTGIIYKWYTTNDHNNSNIVSTPTSVSTGTYYLFAYSTAGDCYSSASQAVSVVINSLVTATVSNTNLSACTPASINLSILNSTTGTNTYQWHTVSSNPTYSTLVVDPTKVTSSGTYYLYAINQAGCIGQASAGVAVTINTTPTVSVGPVESFCGQSLRTIQATTNAASPTYTWQSSANDGLTWLTVTNGVLYSGATTATLSINNTTGLDGYLYRVNVQASGNICSATSDYAILVEEKVPTISAQPANKITSIGGTTTLFTTVTNTPTASYQWKVSTNGGNSYSNLSNNANYSGANSNPLIIINAPVTFDGYLYKCEIYNYCDTLISNAALLNVTNSNLPPIATDDTTSVNEGGNVTGELGTNDTDPEGGSLGFTVLDSTNHGTITINPNGGYTYTPDPNFNGKDTLTYVVCDNGTPSKCDTAKLIISVNPINNPPIALDDNKIIDEDGQATGNLGTNDTDPEGGPLGFTILDSTKHGNIVVNPNGTYTYTPDPNFNGKDTLTYVVCDNGTPVKCDTAILVITVNPINDPPVALNDEKTLDEDGQATGNLGTNDIDPEGGPLGFTILDSTKHGNIVVNPNGTYTYTPDPNFNGKDTLRYVVCDNGTPVKCDTAILVITVNPVNDPPVAVDDEKTLNEDGQATGNLGTNDTDPEGGPLGFTVLDSTKHGNIVVNPNGTYTYTPDPNFNGKDTLRYVVCDNGTPVKCDTAILVITVNPVNDPPVAVDDTTTINQGSQASGTVATNDYDLEGNTLGFSTIITTKHGTLVLNSDGTYTYIPDPTFSGKDTLVYKVCDNGTPVECDTAILVITVNPTVAITPKIGVAKSVSEPVALTDETFELTYTIYVKNYGNVDLKNVRVIENLSNSFPNPAEFNVLQLDAQTGLTVNNNFNGVSNFELLDSANSDLLIGETKTITLKIFLKPNTSTARYTNAVLALGTSTIGGIHVSDSSVEGTNPDPNSDGNPNETSGTEVTLEIFVPTGFSPDGDGINDGFVIKGIENYPNNVLRIYNRWGNIVYEKSPYDNSWKGDSQNAPGLVLSDGLLPNGTYFYILDFGVQGIKPKTGFVVIKK